MYLSAFCLFIIGRIVSAQQRLPHQSCFYHNYLQDTALVCNRVNLVLPDNFEIRNIPSDVADIRLECPRYERNIYCNVMRANGQPFPALQQLRSVVLCGFKGEGDGRFPVNHLLSNVKQRIETLEIRNSRIDILDRGVLAGFSSLRVLTVGGNGIGSVALDAFHSLPALHEIHLGHNQIKEFDWSALQPLSDTLMDIGINSQTPRLQKLHRSGPPFTLKKLNYFTLIDNGLSFIPKAVLDTIPALDVMAENKTIVRVEGNPFCPANPDCSCCEMKDFFAWVDGVKKAVKPGQNMVIKYSCGVQGQENLHQVLVNSGVAGYSTGADDSSLKSAAFKPSAMCVTVPPPTPAVVVLATTVKTSGASQGVVSSSAFLLAGSGTPVVTTTEAPLLPTAPERPRTVEWKDTTSAKEKTTTLTSGIEANTTTVPTLAPVGTADT